MLITWLSIATSQYVILLKILWCLCRGCSPLPIPNREVKPLMADGTAIPGGRVGRCHIYYLEPCNVIVARLFFLCNVQCEMWDVKCETWNVRREMWNVKCETWNVKREKNYCNCFYLALNCLLSFLHLPFLHLPCLPASFVSFVSFAFFL